MTTNPATETQSPGNPYSLIGLAFARFRENFGDPNLSAGNDHQWSLKTSPFGSDLYVLIGGSENRPVVWLFDSNDRNDGVSRSILEHEDGIIDIIDHVRDRVLKGSRIARKANDTPET